MDMNQFVNQGSQQAPQEPKSEVVTDDFVQLQDVSEPGGFRHKGDFEGRLTRLDPTQTKKGEPALRAFFDVVQGPHEGEEISFFFWLGARKNKKTGKIFAPGIAEIRQSCANVGAPLGNIAFPRDPVKAGRLFATAIYNKRVRIRVLEEQDEIEDEETGAKTAFTRYTPHIVGVIGGQAAPAGVTAGAAASPQPTATDPLHGIV